MNCSLAPPGIASYRVLVHRPAASLHASSPRSVTLPQLRFASFGMVSFRRDSHPQGRAHAGREIARAPPARWAELRRAPKRSRHEKVCTRKFARPRDRRAPKNGACSARGRAFQLTGWDLRVTARGSAGGQEGPTAPLRGARWSPRTHGSRRRARLRALCPRPPFAPSFCVESSASSSAAASTASPTPRARSSSAS